ncbi:FlaA1/EpsC-like NDP-sugar epimerase [Aneurinibacillus soli]|uniref:UDP-N-acetyl-alpha-D-glucosamine C6 dehydratase n=1 Tax=Aneurinibacillus soli TaxID=1500254 RepID=A0A0U5AWF2_9BACL|nr:nucleoside-diphosphate sugar epimerase/dehydratase [Aneurinibacillus soli]PYE64136.1 FlaA1/EpsC-like NDP-sugar epimerase [Aneurinibacillus soli]BAU28085.1 UDP-N-acetyl-alpha-D-glucosamine C6 dehydratase [Aneurinibacillus soli]
MRGLAYQKRMLILTIVDALLIGSSVFIAYQLRFEMDIPLVYWNTVPKAVIIAVLCSYLLLYQFKIYKRLWRYASVGELYSIVKAITFGTVLFILLNEIIFYYSIPRSIYLISWMGCIISIGGSRFIWRMKKDKYTAPNKRKSGRNRALIIGAGDAGILITKELKHSFSQDIYPVGFIDDDLNKRNFQVNGLPVLGGRESIVENVKKHEVSTIIIALPSAPRSEIKQIIEICKQVPCTLKTLPSVYDLVSGKTVIQPMRDIDVEDLLGRDPVKIDLKGIAHYISDKVVLVTGAGGSIGSELCRQIAMFNPMKLILLGHGENSIYLIENELRNKYTELSVESVIANIQDQQRIDEVFDLLRPNVVFHAAAHKHVPLMEANPIEAVKNNIFGTKNVVYAADKYRVERFVMISSDKAVNPTSVMGVTKRVAEMIIQSISRESNTLFSVVRFGNVLGSRGSVIPLFKRQISGGGPVTVTHPEMIRYFMTIPEAVQLVIQAGAFAKDRGLFVLDMGEPVKIDTLARDLIRLSGFEPDKEIQVVYTGVRPGEKLYEELFTTRESLNATNHNRIFSARPELIAKKEIEMYLDKLKSKALHNHEDICLVLQEIVPTFRRNIEKSQQNSVDILNKKCMEYSVK